MPHDLADTIFAVASGPGRSALTVVRLSGHQSAEALIALCGGLPPARRASLRSLRDRAGIVLDSALVLWFPAPGSYTGEDSAELHLHGGAAVLEGVFGALGELGLRPAEAGEFTRRAVIHGRMDLLEAEAVSDLIHAETPLQRAQALRQLAGDLSAVYAEWAQHLTRLLAQQEALIDFPDEDLPDSVEAALLDDIRRLAETFGAHLAEADRGERLRTGLTIAIVGPPNAGKSTLMNAICRREVAIVSPQAGTTRDVLEARVEIAGVPVTLLDTAGLRETDDLVEAEGIRRAKARITDCDLVISLQAPDGPADHELVTTDRRTLRVRTKCDLPGAASEAGLAVSALSGEGMELLARALESEVSALAGPNRTPMLTRARHRAALEAARQHLTAALSQTWPEMRGEEMRLALHALGRITGLVSNEAILDSVFRQFCIGK